MGNENQVRISCSGAATVDLADLLPLQGDLKSLSKENNKKLRWSILKYGISFPFFAWKTKDGLFILDGHQRDRVLREMRDDGYMVPPLPVDFIEAKNKKEAKEKILLLSSRYGKMTEETLHEYIKMGDLEFPGLKLILDLPEINLPRFDKGWINDETQNPDDIGDQPERLKITSYEVLIVCKSEQDQLDLVTELQGDGYECKALIA